MLLVIDMNKGLRNHRNDFFISLKLKTIYDGGCDRDIIY
jgi:hypothetical protein